MKRSCLHRHSFCLPLYPFWFIMHFSIPNIYFLLFAFCDSLYKFHTPSPLLFLFLVSFFGRLRVSRHCHPSYPLHPPPLRSSLLLLKHTTQFLFLFTASSLSRSLDILICSPPRNEQLLRFLSTIIPYFALTSLHPYGDSHCGLRLWSETGVIAFSSS